MSLFSIALLSLAAYYSVDYFPPPGGGGSEIFPMDAGAMGMGGVSVGLRRDIGFSIFNPAASAWTDEGGVAFTGSYTDGDCDAWSGKLGFPSISLVVPLPGGLTVTGAVQGRSRVEAEAMDVQVEGPYTGDFVWTGGLSETYLGFSFRAARWLAFSLGGRSTFGNITTEVDLEYHGSDFPVPYNSIYRDDAGFGMAWGLTLGVMASGEKFGAGFSISTDRRGVVDIDRDFKLTDKTDTTWSDFYTLPGEAGLGISFRPVPEVLLGADVISRKSLSLLGGKTDAGSKYSVGVEANAVGNLVVRGGYGRMKGLWRDGAETLSTGLGYGFGGGMAFLDMAIARTTWDDPLKGGLKETVFSVSLRAGEGWLGD